MRVRDERVRAAIVETVVAMVDEQGWDGITVRRIGERMHYAASTIVYHLGSFDELTEAVRIAVAAQVVEVMFRGNATGDDRYADVARRLLDWAHEHPFLHRFFVEHLATPTSVRAVNALVPTTFAPSRPDWPRDGTLVYFDRMLRCALAGTLLLTDCPERQCEFLAAELEHLDQQWRRLVMTT